MNCNSITKKFSDTGNVFKMGIFVPIMSFFLFFLVSPTFLTNKLQAQQEKITKLEQDVNAYVSENEDMYEVKRLNLRPRDVGSIFETEHMYTDFFMLRSLEKIPNKIGQKKKLKLYVHAFSFESPYVLENSLRFWFDNFIEGEQVRPGRKLRGYDNARPMYIIIRSTDIVIIDIDCLAFNEDVWKDLTKQLNAHFDPDKEATIIEIFCDGPLEWRQNPPDFRRR